jgi:hypothetical protein
LVCFLAGARRKLLGGDDFFHFDEFVDFSNELLAITRSDSGVSDVHHFIVNEEVNFRMEEVIGRFRLRGGVFELVFRSHQKRDKFLLLNHVF